MSQIEGPIPVESIRKWKLEATQRLLGDTIGIADTDWHAPSLLPGWTRAHVATHLARGADRLRALTGRVLAGEPPTPNERTGADELSELEAGADRTGLDLQIDLDTTAGALKVTWDRVTDWDLPVWLYGEPRRLAALPLARMHEVTVHHIDLDCGFGADDVDAGAARWLLLWVVCRLDGGRGLPRMRVASASGVEARLGDVGSETPLEGPDTRLWAWLAGRRVPGFDAGGLTPPPILA